MRLTKEARDGMLGLAAIAVACVLAIGLWNILLIQKVDEALDQDQRNRGVDLFVYHRHGIRPGELTVNLMSVDGTKSPIDIMRALFQTSAALKDIHFKTVVLEHAGKPMFVLTGTDFTTLGQSYSADDNPVYLIRTLPQELSNPDGSPAFETWTGGMLGVLTKQMTDANDFAARWATGDAHLSTEQTTPTT